MDAYVMLAPGFEEIEALTVVDVCRRAGLGVTMVAVEADAGHGERQGVPVEGSHGIRVLSDRVLDAVAPEPGDWIVLPGGMPGTRGLQRSGRLADLLRRHRAADGRLAAICAAPSVPGRLGLLRGKRATCYPGFEDQLEGATPVADPVVQDGNILTSRGPGTAMPFALAIVRISCGDAAADRLARDLLVV